MLKEVTYHPIHMLNSVQIFKHADTRDWPALEESALPTLSKYKSLANTIKRHLDFLPYDDTYNIHL